MPFDPEVDLAQIPSEPGVYLMRDADEKIIYVGKAANLKVRVKQYFGRTSDTRYFISLLDRYLDRIDVIITANAKEALILENELIKRHQPRFNVELKDDKNFLHLRINDRVDWPRIDVVRRPKKDGAKYYGPYHSASKIRQTLKLVERHFQLRNCDDLTFKNRSRPCLQYQIKRCPAPCVLPINRDEYLTQVREVGLFLQGRHDELLTNLREAMMNASEALAFERAARYRDQIRAIEASLQPQQMVISRTIDRDVYGLYREGGFLQITILIIRRGRMIGSKMFDFDEQGTPDAEVLSTFCNLFYNAGNEVPDEILLPSEPPDLVALTEQLAEIRGRQLTIKEPRRGAGRRLLEMAEKNAEHAFFQARRSDVMRNGRLARLKKTLRLANLPWRMECFDISIFQGAAAVASQVVFEGGVPKRSSYRRYKIRDVEGTDDYAMMREVLMRRLTRGLDEGDLPDLIVVDGGKGQLGVAVAAMSDLEVTGVDVVGLAKARVLDTGSREARTVRSAERIFLPGVKDPIVLKPHTDELFLLSHLRDEAHRFAITHHRSLRKKQTFHSVLDDIPGVGKSRKKALLQAFGSIKRLRSASEIELAAVEGIGPKLAKSLYARFDGSL